MKYFFVILFPFLLSAQNVWYVDRDTTGRSQYAPYDGTSWNEAWQTFDDSTYWGYNSYEYGISWGGDGVTAGDTVYVSGGSDSTVYRMIYEGAYGLQIGYENGGSSNYFDANNPVIVTKAWHTGHNGDVYIINSSKAVQNVFMISRNGGIKFVDMNFISNVSMEGDESYAEGVTVKGHDITFENCLFQNNGGGAALTLVGYNHTIINCTIESVYNTEARTSDILTLVDMASAVPQGGHKFLNCTIWQRNNYGGIWNNGTNMTVTDTSLTDTDINEPIDRHAQANVFTGINYRWYLLDNDSSNATTFYDADGWGFNGISGNGTDITTDNTSLTDPNATWEVNEFVNSIITSNSKTMTVTSNTSTVLTGAGWSGGGNPGNNQSFTVTAGIKPPDGLQWYVTTGSHKDFVQISYIGATLPKLTTVFDKCKMFNITPNSMNWNQGFYITGGDNDVADTSDFLFTNNLFVMEVSDTTIAGFTGAWNGHVGAIKSGATGNEQDMIVRTYKFFNNTFLTPGGTLYIDAVDSIVAYNNIFISYLEQPLPAWSIVLGLNDGDMDSTYIDMDYNRHYRRNWQYDDDPVSYRSIQSGNNGYNADFTWGEWQSAYTTQTSANGNWVHTDENSDTSYIAMVDIIDSVITSYYPPADLIGTDLSGLGISYLSTDLNGVTRTGDWYIGALQYQGSSPSINGGWLRGNSGKKIYDKNGKVIITR